VENDERVMEIKHGNFFFNKNPNQQNQQQTGGHQQNQPNWNLRNQRNQQQRTYLENTCYNKITQMACFNNQYFDKFDLNTLHSVDFIKKSFIVSLYCNQDFGFNDIKLLIKSDIL
jgi:hypothetical protein